MFSYACTFPIPFSEALCMRAKLCPLDLKLSQFKTVFICQWYFFSFASQMSVLRLQESPSFFLHIIHTWSSANSQKNSLPFSFLPLNTLHLQNFSRQVSPMVFVNPPCWRLSPVYLLWTLWAHHLSGRRSFWIRNNLLKREARHTKADVTEMLFQQDFPLNYFLCTGYW